MNDVDVIVIGSGVGGLTAAALLTGAGKKVLVLERHNVPGGYATSFVRGRFEFDVSLHWLPGVGTASNHGPMYDLLEECGVLDRLDLIPVHQFLRVAAPGLDYTLPFGFDETVAYLSERFPAEAEGIKSLFELMRRIYADWETLDTGDGTPDLAKIPSMQPFVGRNMMEVLGSFLHDGRVILLLMQMGNYFAIPHADVSFIDFVSGIMLFVLYGGYQLKGRSQALSQALVNVIRENGSDIRLGCGVSRILVRDGRVTGVLADDGTEICCSHVVSNADPMHTCLELIGTENLPESFLKKLTELTPGAGIYSVYLGLDATPEELGIREHSVFMSRIDARMGPPKMDAAGQFPFIPGAGLVNYSATDPDYGPAGTTVMSVNTVMPGRWWMNRGPSSYFADKDYVSDKLVGIVEGLVSPDIRKHIEVMESGSPLTNMRYTGNLGGSYQGFAQTRMAVGQKRLGSRGPIEGLYFASMWVNGGSYPHSMQTARATVRCLMEDMEKNARRVAASCPDSFKQPEAAGISCLELAIQAETVATLHPKRLSLRLESITEETESSKTFRFYTTDGSKIYFRPGQYVNLSVYVDGIQTSRPYGIASVPGRDYLEITVREKKDGFVSSHLLNHVHVGDVFISSGPAGHLYYNPVTDGKDLLLLAGGSGITPMMSMLRSIAENGTDVRAHLLYGSRNERDIIYRDELLELAGSHKNIRVDFAISEPSAQWKGLCGFLDAGMIGRTAGHLEGTTVFMAGPEKMHRLCREALAGLGVPKKRIKEESCGCPENVADEPGWPGIAPGAEFNVLELRSGRTIRAKASEPLLAALERNGIVLPAVCRSGECSACRTRLAAGKVFMPAQVKMRWIDEQYGYIHPCMAYPLEDLKLELPY